MTDGLLRPWSPFASSPYPLSVPFFVSFHVPIIRRITVVSATLDSSSGAQELTARERRQQRNERRQSKAAADGNWREEVEQRLMKKSKRRYSSWKEELNLDKLALLGPQWWIVRASRVSAQDTAELLARSLALKFPNVEFKIYTPTIQVKKKSKKGSYSIKPKPLFPGCIFIRCILNKELHDFIREYAGVGGFAGSRVGNTIRQINKPRPISAEDIEAIFRKSREEQEKSDRAFEEEELGQGTINSGKLDVDSSLDSKNGTESIADSKPKRGSKKTSEALAGKLSTGRDGKPLVAGSTVRVVAGAFAEFVGRLQKLDRHGGKATVRFKVLGRETLADLDLNQIVAETN